MRKSLPCLIFTSDCVLCDEQDVLVSVRNVFDMSQLKHAFFTSLGGNLRAFRSFCENDEIDISSSYRIYKLKQFGSFRYAFCEKNTVGGVVAITVFLAADQSAFYSLLSPESAYFKKLPSRLTYELFYIKDQNIHNLTALSPDAFLVMSRVPRLVEALFESSLSDDYCNVCDFTRSAVEKLTKTQPLNANVISFSEKHFVEDTPSIVKLPSIPFAFLLYLAVSIASSLSEDHKIAVAVSSLGNCTEVELCTVSHRFNYNVPLSDLCILEDIIPTLGDFVKLTSIIADMADIDSKVSYKEDSRTLSVFLGINYEPSPMPDFKFNDPTEYIAAAFDEARDLLT